MQIRAYSKNDIEQMIAIWNEIVDEGIAFPQENLLDDNTGSLYPSSE